MAIPLALFLAVPDFPLLNVWPSLFVCSTLNVKSFPFKVPPFKTLWSVNWVEPEASYVFVNTIESASTNVCVAVAWPWPSSSTSTLTGALNNRVL